MRNSSPLAQRRRLAQELRRLRGRRGLSLDEVAREMECDSSWLSRVERAERGIRARDVRMLLDIYQVTDAVNREELLDLARQAGTRDWWHRFRKNLKPKFDVYLGLESDASMISTYQTQVVPGILQTPGYARAVLDATDLEGVVNLDEALDVRRARQEALRTSADPAHLVVVLDQAVLQRQVGGTDVMREQLRYLAELNKLPNIKILILPFTAGAHAAVTGSFFLLEFPESADLGVVYLEQATSGLILQSEHEVRRYTMMFGNIVGKALGPEDSAAMIATLIQGCGAQAS